MDNALEHHNILLILGIFIMLAGILGSINSKYINIESDKPITRVVLTLVGLSMMGLSFYSKMQLHPAANEDANVTTKPVVEQEISNQEANTIIESFSGSFRIKSKCDGNFLCVHNGDNLLSSKQQTSDPMETFHFKESSDKGFYQVFCENEERLALNSNNNLITREQSPKQENTLVSIEELDNGTFKIKSKLNGKYWHLDTGGDKLASTRYQGENDPPDYNDLCYQFELIKL